MFSSQRRHRIAGLYARHVFFKLRMHSKNFYARMDQLDTS